MHLTNSSLTSKQISNFRFVRLPRGSPSYRKFEVFMSWISLNYFVNCFFHHAIELFCVVVVVLAPETFDFSAGLRHSLIWWSFMIFRTNFYATFFLLFLLLCLLCLIRVAWRAQTFPRTFRWRFELLSSLKTRKTNWMEKEIEGEIKD